MEKYFLPVIIIVFLFSTVTMTVIGQDYINNNPDRDICVKSRSCAINWHQNQQIEK